MILTGEAKRAFGLYMVQRFKIADLETFEKLDELMQYTLIIDWFDSIGIYISSRKSVRKYWIYFIDVSSEYKPVEISALEDMQESRKQAKREAILKADKLYNSTKVG